MKKRILATVAIAATLACAPQKPDATTLLRDMQSALLENEAFRYRFAASAISSGTTTRILEGEADLMRLDLSGGAYLAQMKAERLDLPEPQPFSGVKTADEVLIVEASEGVAYQSSMYSAGSRLVARMEPGLLYALFDPKSLDGEVAALANWEGTLTVGGVQCESVRVTYADDPEDSRWCIGQDDHLPRRLEWIEEEEATRLDLMELEVVSDLEQQDFSMDLTAELTVEVLGVGPKPGTPVPDFELNLGNGETLKLSSLRGQVVVFDFWATWCAPCISSLRSLEETAESLRDQPVRFLAVNSMEELEPGDPLAFLVEHGLSSEAVLAGDDIHAFFAKGNLPALAVVNAAGETHGVTIGFHGEGSQRWAKKLITEALKLQQ